MPDLITTANDLKGMPDQALQMELVHPSGAVPIYLVMAEAQRRATLRSGAAQHQQAQGSVYDDVLRSLTARQPPPGPPPPPGMTPTPNAPPSGAAPPAPSGLGQLVAPPAAPPPAPPVGMAEGGSVDDVDDEDTGDGEEDDGSDQAPMVERIGSAARSAAAPEDIERYIQAAAKKHNLPPELIKSVMAVENAKRDPNAVSPRGAIGMMQILPATGKDMGATDLTDPEQNIDTGSKYLRFLLDRYHGNRQLALSAYNGGLGNVDKYGGVLPGTESYVKSVEDQLSQAPTQSFDRAPTQKDVLRSLISPPEDFNAPTPPAAAIDGTVGTPPATVPPIPPPAAAAPAAAPATTPPATTSQVPGVDRDQITRYVKSLFPNFDQSQVRAEVAALHAQAAQLGKRNFWQMLSDFGWGMASSPSHFVAQQIAAGGQAMNKAQQAREDEARKLQLQLMGVDANLDTQARTYQEKIAQATEKAVEQATKNQQDVVKSQAKSRLDAWNDLKKAPGAIYGSAGESHGPYYVFSADPNDSTHGLYVPGPLPVTKEMVPFLGPDPITGKNYNPDDKVDAGTWLKARDKMIAGAGKTGNKVTGDTALIALSMGFDPNNLTADQAKKVLDRKKPEAGADVLTGVDPQMIALSDTLKPGQRNDALLQSLPAGERAIIKGLADYKILMPTGGMAISKPEWQKRLALAELYDPTFDPSVYQARQKLRAGYMGGAEAGQINALNTLTDHIDRYEQNMQKLANWGGWLSPLNRPVNWMEELAGDKRFGPLRLNQQGVAEELLKTWRRVGGTEAEVENWKKGLDLNASPQKQQDTISEIYHMVNGKLKALKTQYETGMGRPTDFHMLQPATKARFEAHGVDASDLAPGASYGSSQVPTAKIATKAQVQAAADQFFGGDYNKAAQSFTDKDWVIQ